MDLGEFRLETSAIRLQRNENTAAMDRDIPQFALFDVMFGRRTVDQHGDLLIFHQAESPTTATLNLATFSDDMPEAPVDPWGARSHCVSP